MAGWYHDLLLYFCLEKTRQAALAREQETVQLYKANLGRQIVFDVIQI